MSYWVPLFCVLGLLAAPCSLCAAEGDNELRRELDEVRQQNRELQTQLDQLLRRFDEIQPAIAAGPAGPLSGGDPLDDAVRGLEDKPQAAQTPRSVYPSSSGGRANRLRLIDISMDVLAAAGVSSERDAVIRNLQLGEHDPRKRGFTLQQAELSLIGAVDPYFIGEAHLIYFIDSEGESKFEIEEAFLTTQSLPEGLQVEAGQFFTEFGRHNPRHPHQWTFQDQPVIMSRLFGPDGMRGIGTRVGWLTPLPWFSELHVGAQNANGETMVSFLANQEVFDEGLVGRGRPFSDRDVKGLGDLVWLARWLNAWDLTETISMALGGSMLYGPNASGEDGYTFIHGGDLVAKWRPAHQRRGWPFVTLEAEALRRDYNADRSAGFNSRVDQDWGFYAQGLWGFCERWAAGLRYEFASGDGNADGTDPLQDDRVRVSPLIAFHPSEYSRIRLQYNLDHAQHLSSNAHSLWLGVEFSFGAHPSHEY